MQFARTLGGGPRAPSQARNCLQPLEGKLDPDRLYDLALVVSELVTNAITHSGLGEAGSIVLEVRLVPGRVRVEVTDGGVGFPDTRTSPGDQHGRGLTIVAALADRWGRTRDGGTTVWAELVLP
jgi:anti-sigma regulatory factor (Ser/Thr protein kinase)